MLMAIKSGNVFRGQFTYLQLSKLSPEYHSIVQPTVRAMQTKSFFAGTVVGIAITISAVMLLNKSDPKNDRAQSPAKIEPGVSLIDHDQIALKTVAPGPDSSVPSAEDTSVAIKETNERILDTGGGNLAPIDSVSFGLDPITVTDPHRQLIDQSTSADPEMTSRGSAHNELEKEPRDDAWSYFMEQSIGQYLASHPESIYFEIAGISCRSTTCEIQSFGVDENAGPRWGLIVHDLRNQPWNDFVQTGSSSDTIDGRLVILTHLHRLSEEE